MSLRYEEEVWDYFYLSTQFSLTRSKSKLLIEDLEKMDLRFDHFNLLPLPPLPQNWIFSLMTSIILDLRFDHLSKPPPPQKTQLQILMGDLEKNFWNSDFITSIYPPLSPALFETSHE